MLRFFLRNDIEAHNRVIDFVVLLQIWNTIVRMLRSKMRCRLLIVFLIKESTVLIINGLKCVKNVYFYGNNYLVLVQVQTHFKTAL